MKNPVKHAFDFIWNIGITQHVRPEETKHLRILNVGALFYCINAVVWLTIQIASGSELGWIGLFEVIGIGVAISVFILQHKTRYTLARLLLTFVPMLLLTVTYV